MKRFALHAMMIAAVGASASSSALAADEETTCMRHKLEGLYVFSATGYTIVAGVSQPKAIVELIRFNGNGTWRRRAASTA